MKVFWIKDAENSFLLRSIVYVGKKTFPNSESNTSNAERVVMHLAQPFLGVGRNITTHNWFTSIPLCDQLETAKTSLVGTIRSSRTDVPLVAKNLQERQRGDSKHFVSDHRLLCSFWDKSNSPVLLLFTKHRQGIHLDGEKPEIVQCYNQTKSSVDNLDKLIRTYRCQRKRRRWPYGLFMNFVDVAVIAALKSFENSDHYHFKLDLGYALARLSAKERSTPTGLSQQIKSAMHSGH